MSRYLPFVLALSVGLVGCNSEKAMEDGVDAGGVGTGSDPMPDLAVAPDLSLPDRDPTDHPDLLHLDNHGGPVMAAIEVWTVVWQGDEALGERINRFDQWMLTSEYWSQSVGEYGAGAGKGMGTLVIPNAPPSTIDDGALSTIIKGSIASGLFPMPNVNTVFSFIVPKKTQSALGQQKGCQDYGGYHAETRVKAGVNQYVPYLINLQCGGFGGVTEFDSLTEVVSHEVSETATDPHPYTATAYSTYDGAPLGGEISDLCAGLSMTYDVMVDAPDGGTPDTRYYVTRNWSNKAVAAGNLDPCQPTPAGRIYFNVAVNPTDIQAPAGDPNPVDIDAVFEPYAFGDVGLIKWQLAGSPGSGFKVTPDKGSAMAGQSIPLKVHIPAKARNGIYPIYLQVTAAKGGLNQWVSSITIQ